MEHKISKIKLTPAKCAVDLSVGSERGEYVNQDYILQKLGRPHRAVNLMYCYYPLDKGWPVRASIAHARDDVSFAWDYPYDDYFPYEGGIGGKSPEDPDAEPFKSIRDVRSRGQDVILTLTIDPHVSDEHLIKIANELSGFGRLMLRINHEATGTWFSFNKRCSYKEVADFYVRFHNIIKKEAPHIRTVLCAGGVEDAKHNEIEQEAEFKEAHSVTDIWSLDKYLALNYAWPYKIAERGGGGHLRNSVSGVYEFAMRSLKRLKEITGQDKPLVLSELNADGDVTGAYEQADMIREFADLVKADKERRLSAFTFYQFRDRGRLGLETEDPNNPDVGIEQPVMSVYKEIINDPFFYPQFEVVSSGVKLPYRFRWGGAEDSDGVGIAVVFEQNPVFCEVAFEKGDSSNLIMEINGRWFYKSPKATRIDLMPAFYGKPLTEKKEIKLHIFAPPFDGTNDPANGKDWRINYYSELKSIPEIRVRYEPAMDRK